jgi:hypothetical protein
MQMQTRPSAESVRQPDWKQSNYTQHNQHAIKKKGRSIKTEATHGPHYVLRMHSCCGNDRTGRTYSSRGKNTGSGLVTMFLRATFNKTVNMSRVS